MKLTLDIPDDLARVYWKAGIMPNEAVNRLARALDRERPRCVDCGGPVEQVRWCYVLPTCYACLPPPEPLPLIPPPSQRSLALFGALE